MRVRDLIEKLKGYDPELPVLVRFQDTLTYDEPDDGDIYVTKLSVGDMEDGRQSYHDYGGDKTYEALVIE